MEPSFDLPVCIYVEGAAVSRPNRPVTVTTGGSARGPSGRATSDGNA
jgi:hypothetical protein